MNPSAVDMTRFPELAAPERILLGPGPSMVDPRAMRAMVTPVVGHMDPTFLKLMDRVQDLLRYVFQTANPLTIPISGTGTAAMEAAVANAVEPGDPVLVCVNGYFGGRIAEMARRYGKPVICGAYTPTEILTAWESGSDLVKVFPANIGGPGYIKALKGPLPQIPLVPTGGVELENVGEFLSSGAAALAVGGNLVSKKLLAAKDFDGITVNAEAFAQAVKAARG